MSTTIQVSETTKRMLDVMKQKAGAKSYDELLSRIAEKDVKVPESMFGKVKLSKWTKNDRMKFHGE